MLVRAGLIVVFVLIDVSGFRPVLARAWHGLRLRPNLDKSGMANDHPAFHASPDLAAPQLTWPDHTATSLPCLAVPNLAKTCLATSLERAVHTLRVYRPVYQPRQ
jgi:hypothetical protein